jgi:hypothetical protein
VVLGLGSGSVSSTVRLPDPVEGHQLAYPKCETNRTSSEQVKRRAAAKKVKRDPALRYVSGAIRSIDKALSASEDHASRAALLDARSGLAAILSLSGVVVPAGRGRTGPRGVGPVIAEDALLAYIQAHPGSRSEDIAAGLGTDTAGIRPALVGLKQAGRLVVEGKARATRYSVAYA